MKILIAEDNPATRQGLATLLLTWGHEPVVAGDGLEAWRILQGDAPPGLAILDWMMPGLDGLEICRRLRERSQAGPCYLILLTGRGSKADLVAGLEGGADEYLVKPVDPDELRARCRAGVRIVELQRSLAARVSDLRAALGRVKQLQGLLPICAYCNRIRDDQNYWQRVEAYITAHSEAQFSHGICPDCYEKVIKPEIERRQLAHLAADAVPEPPASS